MILKSRITLLFLSILILAGFFRFYKLNSVPPGVSLDEASFGYNAYSVLETGKDEYGYKMPLLLRAYDDWRPGLYLYFIVPFIRVFGLTAISVRLPSVLSSLIVVSTVYFLTLKLLKIKKENLFIPLLAMVFLAISPWQVYLSRFGHEVNFCLTFSILGIYFFILFADKPKHKTIYLILSAIFFVLTFYTYQSQKIFTPLLVLSMIVIYRKELWSEKKTLLFSSVIGLIVAIPIFVVSLSPNALIRFQGTSIFSHQSDLLERASIRTLHDSLSKDYLGSWWDNRRLEITGSVLRNYFSHFDPTWLFFNTGKENHKVPSLGLLYLWELPLILLGSYFLVKGDFPIKSKKLILAWILISPLAGSITTQSPHAMRFYDILPIPQILSSLGVAFLVRGKSRRKVLILLVGIIMLSSSALFHYYFINFPYEQSDSFQEGLKDSIKYAIANENSYDKIVISNQRQGYQSYMFYLFLSKYLPQKYLSQGGTISGGYNEQHSIGKYEFRPIDWGSEKSKIKTLYLGNFDDFPEGVKTINKFNLLNGQVSMVAVIKE